MYGNRLPKDVEGLEISLKENSRNAPEFPEYQNSRRVKSHYIRAKYHNETALANKPKEDHCSLSFTRAVIKVASSKEKGITVEI